VAVVIREPETEAQFMMEEMEREADEARAAAGYPPRLSAEDVENLYQARLARARERVAAGRGTFGDHITVGAADYAKRLPRQIEGATP
jgi:hypothetical protein